MDERTKALINEIGALAEMVHCFYVAMIGTGAKEKEALTAMSAYLNTTLTEIIRGGNGGSKNGDE